MQDSASFLHTARGIPATARTLLFIGLLVYSAVCSAAQDRLMLGGQAELPSLPGEQRGEDADAIAVDVDSIVLRERGFDDTLGVRLDGYQASAPSGALEKGWLVNSRLGVGGAYTLRSGASEMVLNGVYAPRPDVRIRLSASQLRADSAASSYGGDPKTVLQTGYLASIKKQWPKSRVRPEAGFAVFSSRAAGAGRQDPAVDGLEMGTLGGYMFRLEARAVARERFALSYQAQSTVYDHPLTTDSRERQAYASVDYARTLDDCSQIRGRFSAGPGLSEADLRYEKGAFSIGLLQTRTDDYSDQAILVGYSISLGRSGQRSSSCSAEPDAATPFQALVDAATARSPYLPSESLTRTATLKDAPG